MSGRSAASTGWSPQRVGALSDRYLARDRALGEARVLWEIGADGCDVRELRVRLGLDSGYLSRLLRSLESAGLVAVEQSDEDGRVRTARLSAGGRRRARGARQQQRRSRPVLPRAAEPLAAPAPRRRRWREVERPPHRRARRVGGRRPGGPRCAALSGRVRRGARPALRPRFRPGAQHPGRAPRAAAARGTLPGCHPSRRAGRLRGPEAPRRGAGGAQAHVGRRPRAGARARAPSPRRAREAVPRPRAPASSGSRRTGR